jgi:hypothetical protein
MYKTGCATLLHENLPLPQYRLKAIPVSLGTAYCILCRHSTILNLPNSKIKSKHYAVLGKFHFINNEFGDTQNLKVK